MKTQLHHRFIGILLTILSCIFSFLMMHAFITFAATLWPTTPAGEVDGGVSSLYLRKILDTSAISSYGDDGTVKNSERLDNFGSGVFQRKIGADCPSGGYIKGVNIDGTLDCTVVSTTSCANPRPNIANAVYTYNPAGPNQAWTYNPGPAPCSYRCNTGYTWNGSACTSLPYEPTGLTGVAGSGSVSLSWIAPASDGGSPINDYKIFFKRSVDTTWTEYQPAVISTATGVTVSGLENGVSVDFRVQANNGNGLSGWSNMISSTPVGATHIWLQTSCTCMPTSTITLGNNWTGYEDYLGYSCPTEGEIILAGAQDQCGGSCPTGRRGISRLRCGGGMPAVNCGTSNGGSYTSAPVTNLCDDGSTPTVASTGTGYTWTCGSNICIANKVVAGYCWSSVDYTKYSMCTATAGSCAPYGSTKSAGKCKNNITGIWEYPGSSLLCDDVSSGECITQGVEPAPSPTGNCLSYREGWDSAGINAGACSVLIPPGYSVSDNQSWATSPTISLQNTAPGYTGSVTLRCIDSDPPLGNVAAEWVFAGGTCATVLPPPPPPPTSLGCTDVYDSSWNCIAHETVEAYCPAGFRPTFDRTVTGTCSSGRYYSYDRYTCTPDSSCSIAIPPPPPSAPTGLTGTAEDGSVGLSWTAPASIVTDYLIEYKTTVSSLWLVFNDGVGIGTSTTVAGLSNGISYDFRVKARNTNGDSGWSNVISRIPNVVISTCTSSCGLINIGETCDAFDGAGFGSCRSGFLPYDQGVVLEYCKSISGVATLTNCTNACTTNGEINYWNNPASGSMGEHCPIGTTATKTLPPTPPQNLSGIPEDSAISLAWNIIFGNPADYIIEYKPSTAGAWIIFPDGVSSIRAAYISGLTNGTSYDFRVKAQNSGGDSGWSTPISLTPVSALPLCTEDPVAPVFCIGYAGNYGIPANYTVGMASFTQNSCSSALTYVGGCSAPVVCIENPLAPVSCTAVVGSYGIPANYTVGSASLTRNSCTNAITYQGGCSAPSVGDPHCLYTPHGIDLRMEIGAIWPIDNLIRVQNADEYCTGIDGVECIIYPNISTATEWRCGEGRWKSTGGAFNACSTYPIVFPLGNPCMVGTEGGYPTGVGDCSDAYCD